MIFQIHPEHGKHIAYSAGEEEANKANGWKTVSEEEFYGRDPIAQYTEKFGKPPHHRMKMETILEKLNGT